MRTLKYLLVHGIFAVALYFGFIEGIAGAYNIAMFIAWFSIVVSWFAPMEKLAFANKSKKRAVPQWLNALTDLSVVTILAWHGAMITAGFYLIHFFLIEIMWGNIAELNKTTKEE